MTLETKIPEQIKETEILPKPNFKAQKKRQEKNTNKLHAIYDNKKDLFN